MPAKRVCPTSRCPNLVVTGRCDECKRKAEALRGSASRRGYNSAGHQRFRRAVLTREPVCPCGSASTVADHYPLSRRELIAAGLNPNGPEHGRGLCAVCHNKATAANQPGGWNGHGQ